MRKFRRLAISTMAAMAAATTCGRSMSSDESASLPAWLRDEIAVLEANAARPDAIEIWRLKYRGDDAFLFVSNCCDRYDPLRDSTGKVLCFPTGGFAGQGDGRCPGALHTASERVRIWVAPVPVRRTK